MTLSKKQTEQRNSILEQLYLHGSMSRADLARRLHITPATTTLVTSDMLKEGLIKEEGEVSNETHIGRKKIMLEVTPRYAYYMGLELTDSKLFLCITDNMGEALVTETLSLEGIDNREEEVGRTILRFLEVHKDFPVQAIGIAVPGHYDANQKVLVSNNPLWATLNLSQITESVALPCYIKNNVKCMALRELYLSQEKKTSHFVFMNLKRGMFASYVYQGAIYGDDNYLVGEVGHVVVNPSGEVCDGCGQAGCLQTYASLTSILKKVRYAFEANATDYLHLLVKESREIKLSHVFAAYKMGDEVIQQILDQALTYLAVQLHNVQMMLDIDTIYIHGQLFEEPEIAEKLQTKLNQSRTIVEPNRSMNRYVKPYNPMLGALGGAALAIQQHFIFQEE